MKPKKARNFIIIGSVILVFVLVISNSPPENVIQDGSLDQITLDSCKNCKITSAKVVDYPVSHPLYGDLWTPTWADDDRLYLAFGDATGMGNCLPTGNPNIHGVPFSKGADGCYEIDLWTFQLDPGIFEAGDIKQGFCQVFDCNQCFKDLCPYTPSGLVAMTGNPPSLNECKGKDQCIVTRHVPYGDENVYTNSDKSSSLLFFNERLYAHMHYPPGSVTNGYIAYSDDYGKNWKKVEGSPWDRSSNFKVSMFISMGKSYSLSNDGYVYAMGIQHELDMLGGPQAQPVYLNRVPKGLVDGIDPLIDYQSYEYFSGFKDGNPTWTKSESDAKPLEGLSTIVTGSAMYHEGTGQYLFLSGMTKIVPGNNIFFEGALYEAENPWGPWHKVDTFPAGFIANMIPKGTGPDYFYFTGAGGTLGYNLNILKMQLQLRQ